MRRILSWFLLLAFSLNAMAANGNIALLEKHVDEFTYATTVETDASNHSAYNAHLDQLVKNLKTLQDAGLTQKDVLLLLEKKIQSKQALEALRLKVSLMREASTEEDLKALFSESKDLYSQGASWQGTAVLGGIAFVILAIAAYRFWWNANHECVEWRVFYDCRPSRCESSGSGDNETTTCYGEYCGNFNECVRFEKKEN